MDKIKVTTKDTIGYYWQAARPYWALLFLMLLGVVSAIIIEISIPVYYMNFFDLLSSKPIADVTGKLWSIIIWVTILNCVSWVLWRIISVANDYFCPRIMTNLSQQSYDYLQNHSYAFFANNFVGSLVKRVGRFSQSFMTFFSKVFWDLAPLTTRICGIIVVLYWFKPVIASILFVWIIVFLLFNYIFARWKLKYDRQRSAKDTETTAVLADAVTNQTNVLLFNGFKYEFDRYKKVTEELRRLRTLTWNLGDLLEALQATLMIGVEFGLMALALYYWKLGMLTPGTFVLLQTYLLGLFSRLWDFGRIIRELYESFADAEEMTVILKTPHEITNTPTAKPLEFTKGEIEFRSVNFSYHKTRRVLNNINLIIKPSEKVALVGPSGSGKTTLIKLLFRFYDIDDGKILIDKQKIHTVTQDSLHKYLSLVPQDPILFHRTLAENIRYGQRNASDAEVIKAAQLAHCEEFIESFPQKYETFVGERGVKLSGGERQRVAIARAILKNAPVLVLDEATSSLDSNSEALIQDALKNLMKNKTVIVIAHRLSTIQQMDRIIVLDKGKIIEEGSHDQLLERTRSLYKQLWELQAGGFLSENEQEVE